MSDRRGIRVTTRLERKHTFWGEPFVWKFEPGALKQCLEQLVRRRSNPVVSGLRALHPAAGRVRSIHFDHFQEGEFQLVFRTRIRLESGRSVNMGTILSKDAGRCARIARTEHGNLRELYGRNQSVVVRPLEGGTAGLRWRSGLRRHYVYCSQWLQGFHELGVNRRMNFYINERPFHNFDKRTTRQLKAQIIEICMELHDPLSGAAIEPPLIGAGDFVVTRPRTGKDLRLKLIACRKIQRGLTEGQARKLYTGYRGEWNGKIFSFT